MSKKAQIACRVIVNTNSDTALPAAHLREIWFSNFIQPHLFNVTFLQLIDLHKTIKAVEICQ